MCVCTYHNACGYLQRLEEGVGSPAAGGTGCRELPDMGARN